jgi:hypothetical protein
MTTEQYQKMMDALNNDEKGPQRAYWKPTSKEVGEWTIRLLPPNFKEKELLPYFRHLIHYVNGKGYECIGQTLVDSNGNLHKAERCPFCEKKEALYRAGEKGSEEWTLAGQLRAKDTYDYRGINRSDEENPKGVKIIRIPKGINEELMEKMKSQRHGNVFDIKKGRDIVLIKKGIGIGSSYSFDLLDESEILDKADLPQFIEDFKNCDYNSVINFPTYEECETALKIFLGEEDSDEVSKIIENKKAQLNGTKMKEANEKIEDEISDKSEEEEMEDDVTQKTLDEFFEGL